MKFASFDRVISPEVGACIAGYEFDQRSVCKADDLHAIGLLVVAGGYEGDSQVFTTRDSVRFLQTAADAMFDLRDSLFPKDVAKDEPYPDFVIRPLVDIPKNRK